jgi:hypothetical protein
VIDDCVRFVSQCLQRHFCFVIGQNASPIIVVWPVYIIIDLGHNYHRLDLSFLNIAPQSKQITENYY